MLKKIPIVILLFPHLLYYVTAPLWVAISKNCICAFIFIKIWLFYASPNSVSSTVTVICFRKSSVEWNYMFWMSLEHPAPSPLEPYGLKLWRTEHSGQRANAHLFKFHDQGTWPFLEIKLDSSVPRNSDSPLSLRWVLRSSGASSHSL